MTRAVASLEIGTRWSGGETWPRTHPGRTHAAPSPGDRPGLFQPNAWEVGQPGQAHPGSTGQGPSAEVWGLPAAGGQASSESGGHSTRGRLEATSPRPSAFRGSAPQLAPGPSQEAPRATPGGLAFPGPTEATLRWRHRAWGDLGPLARLRVLEGRAPRSGPQRGGCGEQSRRESGRGAGRGTPRLPGRRPTSKTHRDPRTSALGPGPGVPLSCRRFPCAPH